MLQTAWLLPQKGFRRWASTRPVSRPSRQPATGPPGSYPDGTHTRWQRRAYVGSRSTHSTSNSGHTADNEQADAPRRAAFGRHWDRRARSRRENKSSRVGSGQQTLGAGREKSSTFGAPRALPHPRHPRRRRRPGRRRGRVRQTQGSRFRWACNKRLRQAFVTLADTSRHHNPWAQDLYAAASARGHDHPRAIRTLGRGWCRIVWRCWQDRVPYDPARHRALQRHATVTIPTSSGPRPDTAATQRMAGAAVTQRAARRAERNALDGKPTSAIALRG